MTMKLCAKQRFDYDCGIFATRFFMGLYGITMTECQMLENGYHITELDGSKPDHIVSFLNRQGVMGSSWKDATIEILERHLPAIVNYTQDGDGHYGVIIGHSTERFFMYDPAIGDIRVILKEDFEKVWESPRYYKHYFIDV